MFLRNKLISKVSVFILLALTATIIHYQLNRKDAIRPKTVIFSRPLHDINGLHYTRIENTRRIYVIQADRLRVQKKKIGVLRFGLIKEIIVDNVTIDFYKPSDRKLNLQNLTQSLKDSKTVRGMIPKSTGKVIFTPVILRIFSQERHLLSEISAEYATFNLKNRQIVFERNVEIRSGNRTLNAASLAVISKHGQLIARQGVILKTPGKTITRDLLETDMFLTEYR